MDRIEEALFLTKQSSEKLRLFREIEHALQQEMQLDGKADRAQGEAKLDELNLHRAAVRMQKNYGTVYYTYMHLLRDLQAIAKKPQASKEELFALGEGRLRMALVRQGVPFAFLQHLIAEDLPDFNAFINSVGYSRVTCLRYLRPLRDLAKQLGLRIVYENIQIIGDEDRVRIFLTLMYWSATDGVEWPFVNCSRTQASLFARQADSEFKLEYHSPVLQELLAYFVAVTQSRVAHHHQFSELVTMIADPVANLFKKNRELTWPEQISESQHLFLVSFLLPIYYTPGDPRLRS